MALRAVCQVDRGDILGLRPARSAPRHPPGANRKQSRTVLTALLLASLTAGFLLLGGGAALTAHAGKAGARGVVNASPEPVSNVAVSTVEDVATAGLLYLAYEYPYVAGVIALVILAVAVWLIWLARKIVRSLFRRKPAEPPVSG